MILTESVYMLLLRNAVSLIFVSGMILMEIPSIVTSRIPDLEFDIDLRKNALNIMSLGKRLFWNNLYPNSSFSEGQYAPNGESKS